MGITNACPASYAVTLTGNGGTGSALTRYTEGTGAALPTDWTKDGYTFAGWYDNADLTGNAVTAITSSDTGAKAFYAKWTKNGDGATAAPKTPVKVKAKAAGTHSIKITWSKAKGASYYKIYKVTKKSGASAKSNSYKYIGKTSGTSFTAKSLKAGTTYSFKVKAVNSAGNSKLSKIVSAKTKAIGGTVSFTLSNISGNDVKVHWSKVSGASKYQVANNSSGKMKVKWTGTNSMNTYTSTNLTKGKTYKYKMRYCKVKSGKNVWSKWSSIKTIKVK